MNSRVRVCLIYSAILLLPIREVARASEAFIGPHEPGASAVDAKGIRHTESAHSRGLAPWIQDGVKLVGPSYPTQDQLWHHTGIGLFRIYLVLRPGAVKRVS